MIWWICIYVDFGDICEYVLNNDIVHICDNGVGFFWWLNPLSFVACLNLWNRFDNAIYMIMQGVMNSYVYMLCVAYYYIFLWWCEFSPFYWNDVLCDIAQVPKIAVVVLRTRRVLKLSFACLVSWLGSESMLWSCNTWEGYLCWTHVMFGDILC